MKDLLGLIQEINMANIYKNAQFNLTTTDVTDIYTVPSNSRAII